MGIKEGSLGVLLPCHSMERGWTQPGQAILCRAIPESLPSNALSSPFLSLICTSLNELKQTNKKISIPSQSILRACLALVYPLLCGVECALSAHRVSFHTQLCVTLLDGLSWFSN